MGYDEARQTRMERNAAMAQADDFYRQFGELDDMVYAQGAISKKNKELMGLAISLATRCDECIAYHVGGCVDSGARREEILEAIRIGVIAGGSITYPNARYAFSLLKEIGMI